MSLALFMVSMLGIISMQKMVVASNAHAKNLAIADRIARTWGTQLQLESTRWRTDTLPSGWLSNVGGSWKRLDYDATRGYGPAFDALGNPLPDTTADLGQARFCAHVRLTSLYATGGNVSGSGMLRAEVRVFWLRDGETTIGATTSLCPKAPDMDKVNRAVGTYHFVHQTFGLRQHFQI